MLEECDLKQMQPLGRHKKVTDTWIQPYSKQGSKALYKEIFSLVFEHS